MKSSLKLSLIVTTLLLVTTNINAEWLFEGSGHSYWSNAKKQAANKDERFTKETGENDSSFLEDFHHDNPEPSWTCKYYKLATKTEKGKCKD